MNQKELEHEIAEIMKPLHIRTLNQQYISWGTFMRTGLKCSRLTSSTSTAQNTNKTTKTPDLHVKPTAQNE